MRTMKLFSSIVFTIVCVFSLNAQYTKLYDFPMENEGGAPRGDLVSDGTYLYGGTPNGGANNVGVIFKVKPDGTEYSVLLTFNGAGNGYRCYGSLILDGSVLYGMAWWGGANNKGTIFKINTDGTGYTKLLDFDGAAKGSSPMGALVLSGTTLYGTTQSGGTSDKGCIFKIETNGTGFLKIVDFDGASKGSVMSRIN